MNFSTFLFVFALITLFRSVKIIEPTDRYIVFDYVFLQLFLNKIAIFKNLQLQNMTEMIAEVGSGSEGINCHIYFVTRLLLVAQSSSTSKRAIPNHHFLRLNLSCTRSCLRLFSQILWYFLWSIVAWLWIIIQCLSFLAFSLLSSLSYEKHFLNFFFSSSMKSTGVQRFLQQRTFPSAENVEGSRCRQTIVSRYVGGD